MNGSKSSSFEGFSVKRSIVDIFGWGFNIIYIMLFNGVIII